MAKKAVAPEVLKHLEQIAKDWLDKNKATLEVEALSIGVKAIDHVREQLKRHVIDPITRKVGKKTAAKPASTEPDQKSIGYSEVTS